MAKPEIRPIRVEGNIAYITLTKGYEAVIDAADVPLVEGVNWMAAVRGTVVYAVRIARQDGVRRAIYLHRILGPEGAEDQLDHADGDGLNNRRCNLRPATHAQNQWNKGVTKRNKVGMKGVSWHPINQKWRARIRVNGRNTHLGFFDTPEEAHEAHRNAADQFRGEFSRSE